MRVFLLTLAVALLVGSAREIFAWIHTESDGLMKGMFYRWLMKLAHRFNWHYAPPIYPEGDTQLWCKWCGFRQTIKRRGEKVLA